jgi:uncharacterized membrane protein
MALLFVLIIGFFVRLIVLNQSFWLDEAIGTLVAKNQSFLQILTQFPKGDNHPPLYYLTLKAWGDSFGYSEVAIKMLSVIAGTITIFFVYKISEFFIDKKEKKNLINFPFIASLLFAFAPLHIYYSQEARMYVFSGLFATMSVYFFLNCLREEKNKFINWFFYSTSLILIAFSDYLPIFLSPVFFIYALLSKKDRNWWIKHLLSYVPLGILGLFWMPIFIFQSNAGKIFLQALPTWKAVAGGATLKQLALVWVKFIVGRISFDNFYLYLSLIIIFSIPFLISLIKSFREVKKVSLIVLWLLVPTIFAFFASFFIPAFIYFRFMFVLPAFYILVAFGISLMKNNRIKIALIVSILAISSFSLYLYYSNKKFQRENWREAVSFVESRVKENELIVFANPEPFAPYRWYAKSLSNALGATDTLSPSYDKTYRNLEPYLRNKRAVYYFEYLQEIMDPSKITYRILTSEGFKPKETYPDFIGVGNIIYLSRQ